ncbi:MAG: hypothetical protein WC627_11985 [Legionella sp.]|jgi:hypothetical protein
MITKEQAMTASHFKQIARYDGKPMSKPNNWRASGKCKTWVTRPEEFKLPIKFGLYDSSYLTHENAHLFEVAE